MTCFWKDLGLVTAPGLYEVRGVGKVEVTREDLHRAGEMGGNPVLVLEDLLNRDGPGRTFGIRFMRRG
jgi:hypothetical protein